ncbi:SH3 domain-containing protein [Candidatus Saccharibacteria bacterium]|nr:SH3 domain-containing protein [Candidatus Saccharibacteria bacterium]
MGSCYAKRFIDICKSQWGYQAEGSNHKHNKFADELDRVDYFTGCGPKQDLDFCAVGLCWAMWRSIIDPDADTDPDAAKWAAHYFMYQSDSCDMAAVVKYLYQYFADNNAVTDNPERGDIVIFQKSNGIMYHCGAVTDWDWDSDSIEVTEFNTNGGQVLPHYYSFKDIGNKIKCFCRPRYDGFEAPSAPDPVPVPDNQDLKFDPDICKYCPGITLKVNTVNDPLNLRAGPNTKSPIICRMPKGASVTWRGFYSGDFYKVEYKKMIGFAHKDYLTK